MSELGLLKEGGFALDLGCGDGSDSDALKALGYEVTPVDIGSPYPSIKEDIRRYRIDPDRYDVIICNNVLPFISDKEDVKKALANIFQGLNDHGVAFLTFFGPKDDWAQRPTMSFFDFAEITGYLRSFGLFILESSTTEGYGKTMKGNIKYCHIHRFLCSKAAFNPSPCPQ